MKRITLKILVSIAFMCGVIALSACSCNGCNGCGDNGLGEHKHTLAYHHKIEATCVVDGTVEYWSCTGCNKNFSDAGATTEIENLTIEKTGHSINFIARVDSTCNSSGTVERYNCGNCDKNFSDSKGENELTNIEIKPSHNLTYNVRVESTCKENGHIAHYHCLDCNKNFKDKNASKELENVIIFATHRGGTEIKNEKAPNLEEEGYTGDTYCLGCGDKLASGETIEKLTHLHTMQKVDAKKQTCTENGNIEYYTCNICEKIYKDIDGIWEIEISATVILASHTLTYNEMVDSTCIVNGTIAHYHCSECNNNYEDEYGLTIIIDITIIAEHTLTFNTKVDSSCTENGTVAHYHCSECNNNYEDEKGLTIITNIVIKAEHTLIYNAKIDNTCTESGTVEHYHCTECNKNYSDNQGESELITIIINPSHNLIYNEYKGPTCTENGNEAHYHCSGCNKNYEDVNATIEIKITIIVIIHYESDWQIVTKPTCESAGYRKKVCTDCGKILREEAISPTGHNFNKTQTSLATCTGNGYINYTCQNSGCGKIKKEILYAHGHYFDLDGICTECDYQLTVHTHSYSQSVTAPTCSSMGFTTYTCSCGYSYTANYIEPLAHDWNNGVVTVEKTCVKDGKIVYTCQKQGCGVEMELTIYASHEWAESVTVEATCTTSGKTYKKCTVCGEEVVETISASHKWGGETVISEPTCDEEGKGKHTCTVCNYSEEYSIKEKGHNFVNGSCTKCGATIPDIVVPSAGSSLYGMYFEIDDVISNYGPEYINEYGVMLDYNSSATLNRVAVYLTQEGNMWRRSIAVVGKNITYATYVPYLSYGEDIKYTGLNSSFINTFSLRENQDGIWCYNDYATIGVNLEDMYGNLLLSLYHIGKAGAETRIFDNLSDMKEWLKYGEVEPGHSHSMGEWEITVTPTCKNLGMKRRDCTSCDYYETEVLEKVDHVYVSGECKWCNNKEPSSPTTPTGDEYTRVDVNNNESASGEYILFGSYPQTDVTTTMSTALSSNVTDKPSSSNNNGWTSYGYYISGRVSNFMWYKDVTHSDGNKYRAVYFTSYRPYYTSSSSSTGNSNQDDNGYYISTVYWFKFEPIKWRILSESNGEALILSEMILDSQQFDYDGSYSNNYAQSTIRSWLNDNFYNTAFNDLQKELIIKTTVDNSASTTSSSTNQYACENTNDNIFLLSYKDVLNTEYGFSSSYSTYDVARQKKNSDYAKVQGCWTSTNSSYLGNGCWWLRSPSNGSSDVALNVGYVGRANNGYSVSNTDFGVVPALRIQLS